MTETNSKRSPYLTIMNNVALIVNRYIFSYFLFFILGRVVD